MEAVGACLWAELVDLFVALCVAASAFYVFHLRLEAQRRAQPRGWGEVALHPRKSGVKKVPFAIGQTRGHVASPALRSEDKHPEQDKVEPPIESGPCKEEESNLHETPREQEAAEKDNKGEEETNVVLVTGDAQESPPASESTTESEAAKPQEETPEETQPPTAIEEIAPIPQGRTEESSAEGKSDGHPVVEQPDQTIPSALEEETKPETGEDLQVSPPPSEDQQQHPEVIPEAKKEEYVEEEVKPVPTLPIEPLIHVEEPKQPVVSPRRSFHGPHKGGALPPVPATHPTPSSGASKDDVGPSSEARAVKIHEGKGQEALGEWKKATSQILPATSPRDRGIVLHAFERFEEEDEVEREHAASLKSRAAEGASKGGHKEEVFDLGSGDSVVFSIVSPEEKPPAKSRSKEKFSAFTPEGLPLRFFKDSSKEGLLEKKGKFSVWSKRWFVLRPSGTLTCYKIKKGKVAVTPVFDTNVLFIEAKRNPERPNMFTLHTREQVLQLSAQSGAEAEVWVEMINAQKQAMMEVALGTAPAIIQDTPPLASNADTKELQNTRKEMEEIASLPGNNTCADCGKPDPVWTVANLGIFICIECSGIHRSLGVHISQVRSVLLDKWKPDQLEIMRLVGNTKANQYWEHGLAGKPQFTKPGPNASTSARRQFIEAKYRDKLFVAPESGEGEQKEKPSAPHQEGP